VAHGKKLDAKEKVEELGPAVDVVVALKNPLRTKEQFVGISQ